MIVLISTACESSTNVFLETHIICSKYVFIIIIVCENSNDIYTIKSINDMESNNNEIDSLYGGVTTDIHSEVFNTDFDDVAFDPVEEDDSDAEAAELYGYN